MTNATTKYVRIKQEECNHNNRLKQYERSTSTFADRDMIRESSQ